MQSRGKVPAVYGGKDLYKKVGFELKVKRVVEQSRGDDVRTTFLDG